ncbi:MAG TPA: DUF4388 domain-containing protein [Acidimicrobiales bacterium]|nr:DUF4388 domain-containing protein [Acidimicrobiales bacterium]
MTDARPDLDGTLADFRPAALLAFLAATGSTGALTVRGNQATVTVWMEHGVAVAAESAGGDDVVESLVGLLRTPAGSFRFRHDEQVPLHRAQPIDEDLLSAVAERLHEWESLSDAVPSLSLVVKLLHADSREDVILSGAAWSVSVAVASGHSSVSAVADHLGWSTYRTCRAVRELVDAGRATLVPPPRRRRRRGADDAVAGPAVWHPANRPLWPGAGSSERDRFAEAWDD